MFKEDRKKMIKQVTLALVSRVGMADVTMKDISRELKMKESRLYRDYDSIHELYEECLRDFLDEIGDMLKNYDVPMQAYNGKKEDLIHIFWFTTLTFMLKRKEQTRFTFEFMKWYPHSFVMTDTNEKLASFREKINQELHMTDPTQQWLFWRYIYENTLLVAVHMINGDISENEESYKYVKNLLFYGVKAMIQDES